MGSSDEVNGTIEFRQRAQCVNCGAADSSVVWKGTFDDPSTRPFLVQFHYRPEVLEKLRDQTFELVRCQACDMLYHRRILTPPWVEKLYSEWIDDQQIEKFEADRKAELSKNAAFEKGRQLSKHILRLHHLLRDATSGPLRVLDYGCGDGGFLRTAAAFGFEGIGIDLSLTRQQRAERGGITLLPDLEAFDHQGQSPVQAVTLFQVAEHLESPGQLLRALGQRMAPGGILIVEVPDCRGVEKPKDLDQFRLVQPLEHINAFTPQTLKKMGERAGFQSIPRVPAHITCDVRDLLKTEISRWVQPPKTAQYFRRV